ncbi:DUF4442 domain-containing protein [Gordonibacter sp. An230]|uniref:PaaI family thioesterase n=1 Tax=Gordonibacter sp. An230 TaxID=1965592 RepID=UPI000B36CDAB|nr:DUF4442 domain-containing protein [Gordonibacter sp. An230]OUO89776.1 DUF4442 domain-containing protein [Gordonibacter sp. An230]
MDQAYLGGLARNVNEGPTPFVNLAKLQPEIVEERHVRLGLPIQGLHMNHVGIAYAGSEFVLAEIAGGTLFMATYGDDEFVPILKGVDIKFLKPGTKDLHVELALTEKEAEEKIGPVRERGRGDYFLAVEVRDADDDVVAAFDFNYYALPAQK